MRTFVDFVLVVRLIHEPQWLAIKIMFEMEILDMTP